MDGAWENYVGNPVGSQVIMSKKLNVLLHLPPLHPLRHSRYPLILLPKLLIQHLLLLNLLFIQHLLLLNSLLIQHLLLLKPPLIQHLLLKPLMYHLPHLKT